jgi:hypothetical protein
MAAKTVAEDIMKEARITEDVVLTAEGQVLRDATILRRGDSVAVAEGDLPDHLLAAIKHIPKATCAPGRRRVMLPALPSPAEPRTKKGK